MIMEIFSHWGVRIFIFRMHYEDYISISPTIFINGAVFSLSAKYPTIHDAIICSPAVINYDRHVPPNKRRSVVFTQGNGVYVRTYVRSSIRCPFFPHFITGERMKEPLKHLTSGLD